MTRLEDLRARSHSVWLCLVCGYNSDWTGIKTHWSYSMYWWYTVSRAHDEKLCSALRYDLNHPEWAINKQPVLISQMMMMMMIFSPFSKCENSAKCTFTCFSVMLSVHEKYMIPSACVIFPQTKYSTVQPTVTRWSLTAV